jgi:site-specific DNA-methyltransferase (adenine-specific)
MAGLAPNQILHGDCRELLKTIPDASVDSVVTDPPAGISFMGRTWDDPGTLGVSGGVAMPATTASRNPSCRNCGGRKRAGPETKACECEAPDWNDLEYRLRDRQAFVDFLEEVMRECYRVLRPGGHAIVWALPRTSHWTALAIENAGFEIRDCVYHVFGQGFPKSLNVAKAIDKQARTKGEIPEFDPNALQTEEAKKWAGWGTALKPAVECWWLCRKPISGTSITQNIRTHGTGAINIDGTRVKHASKADFEAHKAHVDRIKSEGGQWGDSWKNSSDLAGASEVTTAGRWPSNVVLSHSPECRKVGSLETPAPVINRFDDGMKPFGDGAGHPYTQVGGGTEEVAVYACVPGCPVAEMNRQGEAMGIHRAGNPQPPQDKWDMAETTPSYGGGFSGPSGMRYGDDGGAARFFQNFEPEVPFFYTAKAAKSEKEEGLEREDGKRANTHPTVKPLSLMRYLVKMVTPKDGLVLDPFAGSGSTLIAAVQEGMKFIGIERETEYVQIAERRVGVHAEKALRRRSEAEIFEMMMGLGDDE